MMNNLSTVEVAFVEDYKKGIVPTVLKPWQEDLIDVLEGREPYKEPVKKVEKKKASRPSLTKEEREEVYNAGGVVFMGTALMPGML